MDCDPALGVPRRDIDDGLALLMLLAAPEVGLREITITFGNVKAPVALAQAKNLLSLVGARVPIFEGAHSRHDRGTPTAAAEFLVETVRGHPGEIALLAIGPLTNVATAMQLAPGFASQLRELVIMGGGFRFGIISRFGEFNFRCDAPSAARVLGEPIAETLVTLDVISHAVFRNAQLRQLEAGSVPVARHLAREAAAWLKLDKWLSPPLADETGSRRDVIAALAELRVPVVRSPGGCFVSGYHWEDGGGPDRTPKDDMAWGAVAPNTFGTDEFHEICRRRGSQPYICSNAGNGTVGEIRDWVAYCNVSGVSSAPCGRSSRA